MLQPLLKRFKSIFRVAHKNALAEQLQQTTNQKCNSKYKKPNNKTKNTIQLTKNIKNRSLICFCLLTPPKALCFQSVWHYIFFYVSVCLCKGLCKIYNTHFHVGMGHGKTHLILEHTVMLLNLLVVLVLHLCCDLGLLSCFDLGSSSFCNFVSLVFSIKRCLEIKDIHNH